MKIRKISLGECIYFFVSLMTLICSIIDVGFKPIIYSYILVCIFIFLFILTMKRRNLSIYQIYLMTFFLFLIARPLLYCLGVFDLHTLDLYETSTMNDELVCETLRTIIVFLTGTSYVWLFSDDSVNIKHFKKTENRYTKINDVLKKMFAIYIILFALKILYQIYVSRRYGYVALFNGTLDSIKLPIIFTGVGVITEVLIMFLMFYNRQETDFKKYVCIFMLLGLVRMLSGKRGYTLSFLLFFMYIWSTYYHEIKIQSKKMIGLVIGAPILIEIIANFRYQKAISLIDMLKNNIYFQVLRSQGVTFVVVADTIKYQEKFTNKVPFFIGYIVDFFQKEPSGQVINDITTGNYLGDHLTYTINSNLFFLGRGTGTSIVAEAYNLCKGNMFMIFLFALITTAIVLKISQNAYKSIFWFALSYYLLLDFILSPRGSILGSITSTVTALIASLLVGFFESRSDFEKA